MKKSALWAACLLLIATSSIAEAAKAVILFPGSGARPGDFLLRNKSAFAGFKTFVVSSSGQAAALASSEHGKGDKVFLVAMSLGTVNAAATLRSGAPVDGAVFVSGIWSQVMATLGTPNKLPPTLVVENPNDSCPKTPPSGATSFARWSAGKASLRLVAETGKPVANPCTANAGHGFFHKDGAAIGAIVGFIRSH